MLKIKHFHTLNFVINSIQYEIIKHYIFRSIIKMHNITHVIKFFFFIQSVSFIFFLHLNRFKRVQSIQ